MSPFVRRASYVLLTLAAIAVLVFLTWQALQVVTALLVQFLLLVFLAVMGPEALLGSGDALALGTLLP
ncbi:hypothetical protein AB0F17_28655 [Nonomuraea sp. NPDC026600]|uniref:hypothetical protein n=1 Tax=Nonomuraea sp. NPDC026600 TaxID=3155363 RepID=UPI0033EBC2C8